MYGFLLVVPSIYQARDLLSDVLYIHICIMYIDSYRSTKRFVFFNLFILFLHMCYIYICFQLVAFVREHVWHKTYLMGYSMRLELTRASSINDLSGQTSLYRGRYSSFLECVYFSLLYPSLIFDIFVVVCVYVCVFVLALEGFWVSLTAFFVRVSVYHGEFCVFKIHW